MLRPVEAGEEITVSYTTYDTFDNRQSSLKGRFGFDCACDLCSLPLADRKLSNARLQIFQLQDRISAEGHAPRDPEEALLGFRKIAQLLGEVRIYARF